MFEKLGVMQGRLLPKYQGRYQAHPVGYWQDEFLIAHSLSLQCIEFIFDYDQAERNPLMHRSGLEQIRRIEAETGVCVTTICADYLMLAPLHCGNQETVAKSSEMMQRLLINAKQLGITDIVIPCVDQSSLQNESERLAFVKNTRRVRDTAEHLAINLALETDLPPQQFSSFLDVLDSEIFTVNYDTGNSACFGYNPEEELAAYGPRITDLHLKDRVRGGNSVEMGTGDVNFKKLFTALERSHYTGPMIMQAYRDDEGIGIFKKQWRWIISQMAGDSAADQNK